MFCKSDPQGRVSDKPPCASYNAPRHLGTPYSHCMGQKTVSPTLCAPFHQCSRDGTSHLKDVLIRFHQEIGCQTPAEADKNSSLNRRFMTEPFHPDEILQVRVSWISWMTTRLESFFFFCMINMPRAIRRGVAGRSGLERNRAAYLTFILT